MYVLTLIPGLILFVSLVFLLITSKARILTFFNNNGEPEIDFNSFIRYKDGKIFVHNEETPNLTNLALKIQQHIGSVREDFVEVETIEDLH